MAEVLLALILPVAVALLAAAVAVGGRAARGMAIFAICWVLVHAI